MQRWLLAIALAIIGASASAQTPLAPEPPKFARVSGVVIDEQDGRLLRRAMVCLHGGADIGYDSRTDHCNETDAQGRFNIANLPPARYGYRVEREGYFAAEPTADGLPSLMALNAGDDLSGVKLRMRRMGSISGRVVFADGEPFPGADLSLDGNGGNHQKTGDTGEYRFGNLLPGDHRILVNHPNLANCDSFSNRQPRLYIDRTAGLDMPPIHVDAGQDVNGPEIVMVEAMPHRVTGRIVWDRYPLPGGWRVSTGHNMVQARNSDGAFAICGLVAGEYTMRTNARIDGRMFAGESTVRIEDEDLKDVEITPEPSASIHARIEVEDNAPLDLAVANIYAISDSHPHDSVPQPRRQPDGSFLIDEVYTGEYRFYLSPLPSGGYLKSARINGQDIIETPFLVHSGENLDGLVFTVSSKAGTVTGVVQDETGSSLPNADVILQPDPMHSYPDIHVCLRTADQNGGFSCDGLAPGKYRIAAWRDGPLDFPQARNDVALKGTPVELPESGRASIVLTVSK
jgi:hypothetical protein